RPTSFACAGSSYSGGLPCGATIGSTCQSNSSSPRTSRSHHELTPPSAYGYVPSVSSSTRGRRAGAGTGSRSGAGSSSASTAAMVVLPRRRLQRVQARLEGDHRTLDLLAELEQRLADHEPLHEHAGRLVRDVVLPERVGDRTRAAEDDADIRATVRRR